MWQRPVIWLATAALVAVAACDGPYSVINPQVRPSDLQTPPRVAQRPSARPPTEPSAASLHLADKYRRIEQDFLNRDMLRRDGGGPDTPFSPDQLTRNFLQIALYNEYQRTGSVIRAQANETRLRRWEAPVRIAVHFGDRIPPDRQIRDRNAIGAYAARLAQITGADIATSGTGNANFHVLIMDEDSRQQAGPTMRHLIPGLDPILESALVNMPPDTLCAVVTFSTPGRWSYSNAIAIIRDEHPDLMRLSCIHEELAQGLGLANDSPYARPSIFNDDEEFALLTDHDELLLKMLYDPRLRSGMTLSEAAPIARQIAYDLMGQPDT